MRVQDTLAQALTWIEYKDDFSGYMEALEYDDPEAAYRAYRLCGDAYMELSMEKDSLVALAKHFNNL